MSYLHYQLETQDFEISNFHPPKRSFTDGTLPNWPDGYGCALTRNESPLRFVIYDGGHCPLSRDGLERLIRPLVRMHGRNARLGESPAALFFARRPVDIILGEVPGCGWALRRVRVDVRRKYLSFVFRSHPRRPSLSSSLRQDLPDWRAATYGGGGTLSIDFHDGPLHFLIETDANRGNSPGLFQIDLDAPLDNGRTPVAVIHDDGFRQKLYRFQLYAEHEWVAQPEKILMDVEEYF